MVQTIAACGVEKTKCKVQNPTFVIPIYLVRLQPHSNFFNQNLFVIKTPIRHQNAIYLASKNSKFVKPPFRETIYANPAFSMPDRLSIR